MMDQLYVVEERGHATPCWIWTAHLNRDGYGSLPRGQGLAHRVLYQQEHGPISPDRELDHLCRVRACVNPEHMDVVTHTENVWRGANAKLNYALATTIRRDFDQWDGSKKAFYRRWAAKLGVCIATVDHVVNRRTWVLPEDRE